MYTNAVKTMIIETKPQVHAAPHAKASRAWTPKCQAVSAVRRKVPKAHNTLNLTLNN